MSTENFLSTDQADAFVASNPSVRWIDLILFDLNGIARGKRISPADLRAVANAGLMVPLSMYILDPRGNCIEETGRLWETGDPDITFRVLADTLNVIPLNGSRYAQAVITPVEDDGGLDPRRLLQRQQALFTADGMTPVAAVELEFYLTRPGGGDGALVSPPAGISADPDWPRLYQFEDIDHLSPVIDDIYKIADVQDIPLGAIIQESGPGQFEINLDHRDDVTAAATEGMLLKRAVKAAARAHGLCATFMAKPHHDWCGSGMHIHTSLLDRDGNNLFAGEVMPKTLRNAVAGLQATMPEFMAIWAQSANAYRRYQPKSYVAMQAHWGHNNRNVALRLPRAASPKATRIEHRVAGADANPYLVLASILAGIRHGIAADLSPGAVAVGDAAQTDAPALPLSWTQALDGFAASAVVTAAFGKDFQNVFHKLKSTERINFERTVTSLDHLWYADVA